MAIFNSFCMFTGPGKLLGAGPRLVLPVNEAHRIVPRLGKDATLQCLGELYSNS